jgi:hypothetical protein
MTSKATGDEEEGRRHLPGRNQGAVDPPPHRAARRASGPDRSTHDEEDVVPRRAVRLHGS